MRDNPECKQHRWEMLNKDSVRACKICGQRQVKQWIDVPNGVRIEF